jgi:hypothetical protein
LKVLRGDATGELELSGTRTELLALARELRSGGGATLLAKDPDPFPYTRSLARIVVHQVGGKVRVSSAGDSESLDFAGGPEWLSHLAENIEVFAADAHDDEHLHVDYYPEHDYLIEGSGSLVVAIDGDAAQMPGQA